MKLSDKIEVCAEQIENCIEIGCLDSKQLRLILGQFAESVNENCNLPVVNKSDLLLTERLIDKVTVTNLDLVLRMVGITFDKKTIYKIIDLVELLENKGDDISIKDICELQVEWQQPQAVC